MKILRICHSCCLISFMCCSPKSCFSSIKNPWRMMLSASNRTSCLICKDSRPLSVSFIVRCFDAHWDWLLTWRGDDVWWCFLIRGLVSGLSCMNTAWNVPALDYIHIAMTAWAVLWVLSNWRKSCLHISIHHHWLHCERLLHLMTSSLLLSLQ